MYKKWDNLDPLMYSVEGLKRWSDDFLNPNFRVEISTNKLTIENIIFNPPATIVFWSDGTKTKAICDKDDKFSKECGISICVAKKMLGNKNFKEIIDIWCEDDKDISEAKYKAGDVIISEEHGLTFVIKKVEWNKKRKTFVYTMANIIEDVNISNVYDEYVLDSFKFKYVYNKNEKKGE